MRRFEFSDETSNKYWEISTHDSSLTVHFGKIGTSGTTQTKSFANNAIAEVEASKLIREKLRKGYKEVSKSPEVSTTQSARLNEGDQGAFQKLSAFELDTIADFLAQAEAYYEDHSCNDYLVPATEQNREVLKAALHYGKDDLDETSAQLIEGNSTADNELFIWDMTLMGYLAHRARSAQTETAEAGTFASNNRLAEAEQILIADLLDYLAENEFKLYENEEGCEDFTLDATPASKSYLAAVVENAKREGWENKRQEIMASQDVVQVFTVDLFHWLALRCRGAVQIPAGVANISERPGATSQTHEADKPPQLGIAKHWGREKTIAKRATEMDDSWLPAYRKNDADMVTYANGGNPFREYDDRDVPCTPPFARHVEDLFFKAARKQERNAILALFGRDTSLNPAVELAKQVAYEYWHWQIKAHVDGSADLKRMAQSLAECLYMGHVREAHVQAVLLYHSSVKVDHDWRDTPQLHQWISFIAFRYWKLGGAEESHVEEGVDGRTPEYVRKLKEPFLIDLFRHWRDPDLPPLQPLLRWLCDFYTHELGGGWIPARLPFCILAWFRLREIAGLSNPVIDHPLMKPDYARLVSPSSLYTDTTLEAIVARLRREELPQLGNLDLQALPEPITRKVLTRRKKPEKFASLETKKYRIDNFSLLSLSIPANWIDRSLPDLLRFRDPDTQTEFAISAYRNPGMSYIEWADARFPAFANAHPWLRKTRERYEVKGPGWWGWAEEFDGTLPGTGKPLHCLTLCFRNKVRLISLTVTATPEAFAKDEELYRMLMQYETHMGQVDLEENARSALNNLGVSFGDNLHHEELWPERQDMPGLKRLSAYNKWVSGNELFEKGSAYYFGWGNTPEKRQASQDKIYATEWFERAAELGIAAAQYNMALVLSNGDVMPKNLDSAIFWCRKSQALGYEKAGTLLTNLEAINTPPDKPFWKFW